MSVVRPLRFLLPLSLVVGCAQPGGSETPRMQHERELGDHLEYPDAGDNFNFGDLASAARDLSQPRDLAPPAGSDLAGSARDMTPSTCAAVENCFNDLDDDCNGKVNDGCPDTLSVGADVPGTPYGGGGGNPASAHCPANQVAIGLRVFDYDYRGHVAGVGVACSPMTLTRGASQYTVQMTMPAAVAQDFAGNDWDYSEDDPCDITQFQVVRTNIIDHDNYVEGFLFNCAQGSLTLSASNQLSISFADVSPYTLMNPQYGWDYGGGGTDVDTCGAGQAVVGYNGRIGGWLDQLQPICAPIVVNYK
jgi:hypothetical protein